MSSCPGSTWLSFRIMSLLIFWGCLPLAPADRSEDGAPGIRIPNWYWNSCMQGLIEVILFYRCIHVYHVRHVDIHNKNKETFLSWSTTWSVSCTFRKDDSSGTSHWYCMYKYVLVTTVKTPCIYSWAKTHLDHSLSRDTKSVANVEHLRMGLDVLYGIWCHIVRLQPYV